MMNPPLLEGLTAFYVDTPRLRTHVIASGPEDGEPIIFIHGNCSAGRFFEEIMAALPKRYRALAPDLRGYGRSEHKPLDGTRGVRDFSDDLYALVQTLGIARPHVVGWSLGGNVAIQYAIDHPGEVASLTLLASGSPYGFGGTRDLAGTPTFPDFAGSGGGFASPEFVSRLRERDRGADSPFSPRNVMNSFYFKPPFTSPREEVLLDEILLTACGPENYPGDFVSSENWPGIAPGTRGVGNALAPKYCNQSAFVEIDPRPPVLWVRGDSDQIVSDTSLFEFGYLGQIGAVPNWPGVEVYPPQPMIGQLRAVLDAYQARGGRYTEVVFESCGHSPHVEKPDAFLRVFLSFLAEV